MHGLAASEPSLSLLPNPQLTRCILSRTRPRSATYAHPPHQASPQPCIPSGSYGDEGGVSRTHGRVLDREQGEHGRLFGVLLGTCESTAIKRRSDDDLAPRPRSATPPNTRTSRAVPSLGCCANGKRKEEATAARPVSCSLQQGSLTCPWSSPCCMHTRRRCWQAGCRPGPAPPRMARALATTAIRRPLRAAQRPLIQPVACRPSWNHARLASA